MLKYAKVENEETGLVSVGLGTNETFYQSIGMTLLDVEQGYDGGWYLADKLPVQPLEEVKENKLNDLSTKANTFEQNVCKDMVINSSIGYQMDADKRSQDNMQGIITIMTAQSLDTMPYRCADNVTRNLSKEQLQTVYNEALINGQNLYVQKWTLEAQINAAETKEALDAIEIKFTMMDFTKNES